jgi:spore coat protein U-like protein
MQGPSAALSYDIYGPSPLTASWSNTAQIAVPFSTLKLGQTFTMNVTATLFGSQQMAPPGNYTQTLAAAATYGSVDCNTGSLTGSTSFSFQATATVLKSCNVSASNLDFGAVGDLNSIVDGQSSLTVQCSLGTGYTIALNGGLSGATDPTARKMTMGTQFVVYGLYRNSARSSPWGTQTNATLGGTGTASAQTVPVYGRVPSQTTPTVGVYSDTIIVSVTY